MKMACPIRWTGCGYVTNTRRRRFRHPAVIASLRCERSEAIHRAAKKGGLLRSAPLAMTPENRRKIPDALRRWLHRRRAEEKARSLRPPFKEMRQGLARTRRAGLP